MNARKWTLFILVGGMLLQSSCTTDLTNLAIDALDIVLTDLLDGLLGTGTA